ncbi:MAG: acyl-CoA thioesterase [Chloroflexi bacterium]|nr:acyl-CoA thioesterase [Chloroflexota bacterium]MBI3731900.1 acyl-CoA thioesterase [Chloroflexota bacterium]
MTSLFNRRFRVRRYECDALGHVNNAVYIQYLEQTTEEALAAAGLAPDQSRGLADARRTLQQLAIEYLLPARPRDELNAQCWVQAVQDGELKMGYDLRRDADGALIARAEAVWQGVDQPPTIPD